MAKGEGGIDECREKEDVDWSGVFVDSLGDFALEKVKIGWNNSRHCEDQNWEF